MQVESVAKDFESGSLAKDFRMAGEIYVQCVDNREFDQSQAIYPRIFNRKGRMTCRST